MYKRQVELPADSKPVGVVPSPDGRRVYVAAGGAGAVFVIDAAALRVTGRISVGERPWGIGVTPDGTRLFTANGRSRDVSVVDTGTLREVARIRVGEGPWGVAVTRARSRPTP